MKKILVFVLMSAFLFVLTSCDDDNNNDNKKDSDVIQQDEDSVEDGDVTEDEDVVTDEDFTEDEDLIKDEDVKEDSDLIEDEDAIADDDVITPSDEDTVFSNVADLSALLISDVTLSESFKSDVTEYTATAEHTIETVKVTATTAEEHSILKVNDTEIESGTESSDISLGEAGGKPVLITLVVTAEDGVTTKTYKVSISRNAVPDPCAGIDCSGHGVCANVDGIAECACEAGYENDSTDALKCITNCIVITLNEIQPIEGTSAYKATYSPNTGDIEKADSFNISFDEPITLNTDLDLTITDLSSQMGATPQTVRAFEDGSGKQYYQKSGVLKVFEATLDENNYMTDESRGEMNNVLLAEWDFDDNWNTVFIENGACLIVEHAEWDTMPKTCVVATESVDCTQGFASACDSETNFCVECTADSYCNDSSKPACDTASNKCVQCNVATENSDCTDSAKSVCKDATHTCVQCREDAQCSGTKPRCRVTTNSCVACTPDTESADCTEAGKTKCHSMTYTCGECSTNADCTDPSVPVCHFMSHTCVAGTTPPPPPTL